MKKIGVLTIAITFLAGLFALPAVSVGASDQIKIGKVNVQKALNEVKQGKRAKAALKREFDAKQRKLIKEQNSLKRLQQDLEKQKSILSQNALMAKQKSFSEKYLGLQKKMATYQQELAMKEAKMTGQIIKNLRLIVKGIGEKEKFSLVVETSQDAVLYAGTKDDLTNRVIAGYNKKFTGPLKITN